ncbi:MAG: Tm-1-like ATP-binding domain-containing protein, partial [Actinomycetota bacterium]
NLFEALRETLDTEKVDLVEMDTDINDPRFAVAMAERLHEHYQTWVRAREEVRR